MRNNAWEDVADLSARFGVVLDPWQENVLEAAMGERADGTWAARQIALSTPRQNGKALDVATPLLTANRGWVTMGGVVPGDLVFHPSGRAVRVVAVSEVMHDRPCFEVVTVDGRSVVADGEHLWSVTDKRREKYLYEGRKRVARWFPQRVVTTAEMHADGVSRYATGSRSAITDGKQYWTNEYRFVLPQQQSLDLPEADLPIDPYLFGAWLGDGTSIQASLTTGGEDLPHWQSVVELCGYVPTTMRSNTAWRVDITCEPGPGRRGRSFGGRLRELGVLGDKHIPDVYLLSSEKQRLALLQGLLDTDGSISKTGQVEFCGTNRLLADGVLFLARSLGWRAVLNEDRAKIAGRDCGPRYRVQFTPKLEDGLNPFRLERKASRVSARDRGKGRMTVSVKSVTPVESRPVRCIQVDAEDGLFLAGRDLVATHNSQLIVARALAGILLFDEKTIIVSAHQQDTAREVFNRILDIIEANPALEKRVTNVMRAINREFIQFNTGQSIRFKARSSGGGRGFSCDCLLLDEAQILSSAAWSAILPTMSARPNPQAWLLGTPPTENDEGEVFERLRTLGIEGKESRIAYLEWSADRDDPIDDPETWAKANPAYGTRIGYEAIAAELASMSPEQFAQERLGIWDEVSVHRPLVSPQQWKTLTDPGPEGDVRPDALGVDMSHARDISVAACWADEDVSHIEEVWAGTDPATVTDWLTLRAGRRTPIVIDAASPAASLVPELKARRCKVVVTSATNMATACGLLENAITTQTLTHGGQQSVTDAIMSARRRPIRDAGGWALDRRDPTSQIYPIVAATMALYGATADARPAAATPRTRKVRVLT